MFIRGEENIFNLEEVEGIYIKQDERYAGDNKFVDCWRLIARGASGREYSLKTYDSKEEAQKRLEELTEVLSAVEVMR